MFLQARNYATKKEPKLSKIELEKKLLKLVHGNDDLKDPLINDKSFNDTIVYFKVGSVINCEDGIIFRNGINGVKVRAKKIRFLGSHEWEVIER